jgi:hypothetical protein
VIPSGTGRGSSARPTTHRGTCDISLVGISRSPVRSANLVDLLAILGVDPIEHSSKHDESPHEVVVESLRGSDKYIEKICDDPGITPARKKRIVGQAFQPDSEPCQAGKPDLLPCRRNSSLIV